MGSLRLPQWFQDGPLLAFSLSHCRLDGDDCVSLCAIFKANPSLRDVFLSENVFSAHALKRLHATLACNVLEQLDLHNTQLDVECGRVIGDILAHSDHLRHVDLSGNKLGNAGVEAVLLGAVTSRPSSRFPWRTLLFSDNSLDDSVLTVLLAVLRTGQLRNSDACYAASPTSVCLVISLSRK